MQPGKFSRMGFILGVVVGAAILVLGLILFFLAKRLFIKTEKPSKLKEVPKGCSDSDEPQGDQVLLPIWSKWMAKGHQDIEGASSQVHVQAHVNGCRRVEKNPVFEVMLEKDTSAVNIQAEFKPVQFSNNKTPHHDFINPLYSKEVEGEPIEAASTKLELEQNERGLC